MNHNNCSKDWKVLCWNVRGINSPTRWNSIRDKIQESGCDIVCLQETKREDFNILYIRKFCPPAFDSFVFLPSVGASGGSLIVWKGRRFDGELVFQNAFAQSVEFTSLESNAVWYLTNIYAPCTPEGKIEFLEWFSNIDMPDDEDWIIVGDFNLIKKPEDRNKPRGNINEMFVFNEAISSLGLEEIPLHGRR